MTQQPPPSLADLALTFDGNWDTDPADPRNSKLEYLQQTSGAEPQWDNHPLLHLLLGYPAHNNTPIATQRTTHPALRILTVLAAVLWIGTCLAIFADVAIFLVHHHD